MKHKGYVNILKEWNKDELFVQQILFTTKKQARKEGGNAITDSLEIVATCKVEWEDKK